MNCYLDLDRWNYAFDRAKNLPKFLRRAATETGDPVLLALSTLQDPRPCMDALSDWVEEDWDDVSPICVPLCTASPEEVQYRAEYVDQRLMPLWKALQEGA